MKLLTTLKEAVEARQAHPDRVQIVRSTRWYVYVDKMGYELLPDRESEDIGHYIDEWKANRSKHDAS